MLCNYIGKKKNLPVLMVGERPYGLCNIGKVFSEIKKFYPEVPKWCCVHVLSW
ncbi:hypothetical protein Enr17x_19430 [Gimesia fumaroli]|uniref:Uncharacterized protein n=1 Tax=Gimesia fumaroli TaxID=2527976 RepID=A0A518I9X9_9PLAN|nr:hypothetical protein Enr17x_19430 [Gimesia fumaroli]